mgnify:CR=1 FL=1
MALRFIDPDATTTVEVDGVTFTIGYWPPREAEKIGAAIAAIRKSSDDRESEEARAASLDAHWRMVEYGVRGFTDAPDKAIESEKINGREHPRVSDRVMRQLYLNNAIWPLGLACLQWNNLSDTEKKTSG